MSVADELRSLLCDRGAARVGYGDLLALPADVRGGLPVGVSIAVALGPAIVAGIEAGPTQVYYAEYNRANALLDALGEEAARWLVERGHRARASAATNAGIDPQTHSTRLPHKTVATRAGLGWVGKCALLVTERFGSAVRLTTVLTDAPLPVAEPTDESRCGECRACVDACPAHAPTGAQWEPGMPRGALYDAFACRPTARKLAAQEGIDETICGICIAACPWTRRYIERGGR
jgi:epoxyqueuosine reductase QueG